MRLVLSGLAAAFAASPALAQEPSLPIGEAEAQALSRAELASLMFGATADQVVAARVDPGYMGHGVYGATFLLRPRPAVDDHIVRFNGACSVRRVRVQLNVREGARIVEDIETDTAWIVTGRMSIIPDDFDSIAGDDDGGAGRRAACAGWDDFTNLVEAPSGSTLMLATRAIADIPGLIESGSAEITCGDGTPCDADYREALRAGRLTTVGSCEDPWLAESLGITPGQTCVTASLRLPGGSAMTFHTLEITAAGAYDYPSSFALERVSMGIGTTMVD